MLVKIQNDWNSQTWCKCKMVESLWKIPWHFFTKLHIYWGIYLNENLGHTKTCIQMFMAALFTIIKNQKQPKCPSESKWTNRLWYIHTMRYYSATQKEQASDICNLDESHRPPWKKPVSKVIAIRFQSCIILEKNKIIVAEISGCQRLKVERGSKYKIIAWGSLGGW